MAKAVFDLRLTRAFMRPIPPALVLSIFTALALALRLIGLNEQLWFDEVGTTDSIRTPLADLLTNYTSDNQHTLYSLMAKCTAGVFGEHPWTLRLPALVLGTLSVPASVRGGAQHNEPYGGPLGGPAPGRVVGARRVLAERRNSRDRRARR